MKEDLAYIEHILACINKIHAFTKGMSRPDFENNIMAQDAVIRNIEIIGEVTKKISKDLKAIHADSEALQKLRTAGRKIHISQFENIAPSEGLNELFSLVKDSESIICFAGLGGKTGTNALLAFAKRFTKFVVRVNERNFSAIVTLPFSFEGKNVIEKANKSLNELRTKFPNGIYPIENNQIQVKYGDLPINQAFAKADELMIEIAEQIHANRTKKQNH